MSDAFSPPSSARRSGLLGIVVAAHVGAFLLLPAAQRVAPQSMEIPLSVDLLQPIEPKTEAKPLPVVKPQPIRQPHTPTPSTPAPSVAATHSAAPAPAPRISTAPELKQSSSAPAAEPLTQARFDADYLRNPAPAYPAPSRRLGEEGKVVLRVLVSPQGMAEAVELNSASGSQRLDDAALNTVRNWRFTPARRGETPVQSWVLVPIIFKLEQ